MEQAVQMKHKEMNSLDTFLQILDMLGTHNDYDNLYFFVPLYTFNLMLCTYCYGK